MSIVNLFTVKIENTQRVSRVSIYIHTLMTVTHQKEKDAGDLNLVGEGGFFPLKDRQKKAIEMKKCILVKAKFYIKDFKMILYIKSVNS